MPAGSSCLHTAVAMTHSSESVILIRLVIKAMQRAGMSPDALFAEIGTPIENIVEDDRTPFSFQQEFWRAAEKISGDPDIGLTLHEYMPSFRGQVIEYLFSGSATFGQGLARAIAYQRLLSSAAQVTLETTDRGAVLREARDLRQHRHFAECFFSGTLRFFREITDNAFTPLRVEFQHAPGATPERYQHIFGCPVILGAAETRLYFDSAVLALPIWHAESRYLGLHESVAHAQLQDLQKQDLLAAVRRRIAAAPTGKGATLAQTAMELGKTPRRLQSELAAAGTNFHQLQEDHRASLARRLLAGTDERIEHIACLAGFTEPSAFYRAFRRWTGMTPLAFRETARRSARR